MKALVDCGATSDFIDSDFVARNRIPVRDLSWPTPVFNVDGTPNEAGEIRSFADVVVNYKGHSERMQLAVTSLGKQDLILGHAWLRLHNPEINWETQQVTMSRCPRRCQTCRDEVRSEKTAARAEARATADRLRNVRAGPFPLPDTEPDADDG